MTQVAQKNRIEGIASLVLLLVGVACADAISKADPTPTIDARAVAFVLQQFEHKDLADWVKTLDTLRPPAVNTRDKQFLKEAGFPLINSETEINDPKALARLYDRARRVLQFHHRDGIVEFIIFRNDNPILLTKAGAYIGVSTRALELTEDDDDELAGVIAHELSHEYVAMEFLQAWNTHNYEQLRRLELLCDAIAVITLIQLKISPDKYGIALRKIIYYSPESQRLNDGSNGMPSLEARLQVISGIERMLRKLQ